MITLIHLLSEGHLWSHDDYGTVAPIIFTINSKQEEHLIAWYINVFDCRDTMTWMLGQRKCTIIIIQLKGLTILWLLQKKDSENTSGFDRSIQFYMVTNIFAIHIKYAILQNSVKCNWNTIHFGNEFVKKEHQKWSKQLPEKDKCNHKIYFLIM